MAPVIGWARARWRAGDSAGTRVFGGWPPGPWAALVLDIRRATVRCDADGAEPELILAVA